VLRLFASYANETSYTVWESLIHNLTTLGRLLSSTDYYQHFRKYAINLFTPTAARLGWDPKDTDGKSSSACRPLVIVINHLPKSV
jgi:puromycin-sensitive aminopeptidase